MCRAEVVAVAVRYEADVFGAGCAVAAVLDEVAVDDGVDEDAVYWVVEMVEHVVVCPGCCCISDVCDLVVE